MLLPGAVDPGAAFVRPRNEDQRLLMSVLRQLFCSATSGNCRHNGENRQRASSRIGLTKGIGCIWSGMWEINAVTIRSVCISDALYLAHRDAHALGAMRRGVRSSDLVGRHSASCSPAVPALDDA